MARRFRKSDIQFHRLGYGYTAVPAVNVKVYTSPGATEYAALEGEGAGISPEWIDTHLSDRDRDVWWQAALEDGWEDIKACAREIFGPSVKVYSEGRSGGWAYVEGLADREDVAGWDAVKVARWGKWAKACRAIADETPYRYLWLIQANVYEPWAAGEVHRLAREAAEMRLSV